MFERWRDALEGSEAMLFYTYMSMSANDWKRVRARVVAVGGSVHCFANALARRTIVDTPYAALRPMLWSTVATVYGPPGVEMRALHDAVQQEAQLVLMGGRLGHRLLTHGQIAAYLRLPPLPQLHHELVGQLQQPGASLAAVLLRAPAQLVRLLQLHAHSESLSSSPPVATTTAAAA